MRWFGGQAFDPDAPISPEWSCFGPGQLILPRLTLERRGTQTILALHLLPGEAGCLPEVNATPRMIPPLVSTGHVLEPNQSDWSEGVCAAVSAIEDGVLRKVVLSRRARVSLLTPPDPFALLAQLAAPQVSTFHFCFELAPGWAFLGCSPERLFSRDGRRIHTEALASTRRRGATAATDQALAEDMLQSPKDREEHDHVVTSITADLTAMCTDLSYPTSPVVHPLHRVQHLLTPIDGTLQDGIDDETLLSVLHPTPAVCGQPSRSARDFIHDHEPFHRGWYAGPVGWISEDRADFAVGIRSALLQDRALWVCAGAGLVAASEPDAEWRELDAKSAQFLAMVEGS
jgi:menaquinone-specific isochorismate synthase